MRVVIQRVKEASVHIKGLVKGKIDQGLLILVGIEEIDNEQDAEWLATKIVNLRVFPDSNGVMNRSLLETQTRLLVVSQFTLHASTKKGNRPSYIRAARPEKAIPLYQYFIKKLEEFSGNKPETGEFGAMMDVSLVNDGPVTILIDTRNKE